MDKRIIFDIVTSSVREVVPELESHPFESEDDLVGLGANSLDRAEIVNLTLEKLALNIPRVELIDAKTIGGLVDVLHSRL